ncbi:DUF257 family protein [Thermococcus thioreducens]|uniref:Uncharacterized protein n=1 Tax=Thermococcus thioreducens TaxID=277988 RepID=A0A0Q2M2L6_9EURY|nr:DUF257 family protein [Thermococcus thioreducens]ASJ11802.1 hypothetical protein A3L14_02365 [Thermococcus thioreducens]KQH82138.1 hypothetical protein AMR53_07305 [Thermococcus thioreducens]SEW13519.1 protein of unknown function, DUF257 [Thermococcus thioreducens]
MQPVAKETTFKFIEAAPFGDVILMEDDSPYGTALATYVLVKYARERGLPVYIDDVLDSLALVRKHLRLLDIEEDFSDVRVIKTGGMETFGVVVDRIHLDVEPVFYITRHRKVANATLSSGKHIHIVLGMERLFAFLETRREFYMFIAYLKEFLGNPNRKSFYIVNSPVLSTLRFNPLPELEEIASTVVEIKIKNGTHVVIPKKALFPDIIGKEFPGTPEEIARW